MVRRGHLDVPVDRRREVGLDARAASRARARDSVDEHGGGVDEAAFAKLRRRAALRRRRLRRPGDLRRAARGARRRRRARRTTSRSRPACSPTVVERPRRSRAAPQDARVDRREAVRPRPRVGARAQPDAAHASSPRRRSSASTTTSARRRCRTSSTSASPTRSSSRSGTATTSRACRSRWPRASASQGRGKFYEETGAIRDVIQNHLLQVVGFLAMEPPGEHVRRGDPRRAGEGVPRDPAAAARTTWCAASSAATARSPGVAPDSHGRDLRRAAPPHRLVALGRACRSSSAPASACRSTTTEVMVELQARRRCAESAPERTANYVRFRLSPEVDHRARRARRRSRARTMVGEPVELIGRAPAGRRRDGRLRAAARRRDGRATRRCSRARTCVEAAWAIVEPILGDVTPVLPYEPGTWGPAEAARLTEDVGGWNTPPESTSGAP